MERVLALEATGPATLVHERHRLLRRIRADYREMPGLMLTPAQMQRFWGIDALLCNVVIDWLVQERVVRRVRDDRYVAFGSPT